MIDHASRCLFVHIPKTGGKSVQRFFQSGWQHHKDLARYAKELTPEIFSSYFKFCIVRNPWDRMLSDYIFQKKKRGSDELKLFIFKPDGRVRTFHEWLEAVFSDPYRYEGTKWGAEVSSGIHRWSPQLDWITQQGKIGVDYLCRLENLQEGVGHVARALRLPRHRLPCRNWNFLWHYSMYYDNAARDLVAEYYASDIEAFGYHFETRRRDLLWLVREKIGPRFRSMLGAHRAKL
jgi:hypothetical protein